MKWNGVTKYTFSISKTVRDIYLQCYAQTVDDVANADFSNFTVTL